jgi:hypothetical protein
MANRLWFAIVINGNPTWFWGVTVILLGAILAGSYFCILELWKFHNSHYRAYIAKSKEAHKKAMEAKEKAKADAVAKKDAAVAEAKRAESALKQASRDRALLQEQFQHAMSDLRQAKARADELGQQVAKLSAEQRPAGQQSSQDMRKLTAELNAAKQELAALKQRFLTPSQWRNPPTHPLNIMLGTDTQGRQIDCGVDASYLVAGAKGWGKSNFMNSAIIQWISRNSPDTLRMIMIDLKNGAELSFYENIPHLAAPVAMTLDDALEQLLWLESEGSRRQDYLRRNGKKKLDDYVESGKKLPFPFIMLVVDEIALMTRSKMVSDDENSIITQCQAALYKIITLRRSAGILPIVATQSPDAQIIDTALRNNLDVRICFRVVDANASRVILGSNGGAEGLNQKGEAIVSANGWTVRIQTPKVENAHVLAAVKASVQQYGKANYAIWDNHHADKSLVIEDKPLNSFGLESVGTGAAA